MAGVTDVAFRALCKKYGAGLTCTEFVSSAALVRDSERSKAMLVTDPSERPVAVQLFGANEEEIVAAAKLVEHEFDVIDMNCGCPAWKVIKTGAGSALLNEPKKIEQFVGKIVAAVNKPVTIKIRTGIDDKRINAVEVAQAAEKAGAAAVAIHGRTQKQGYTGTANWDIIKTVKDSVTIPVIGNGDIFTASDFVEKMQYSGVDAIMIARGAIGNPFIFAEINALLKGDQIPEKPAPEELFHEYLTLALQYNIPFAHIKNHAMSFTKGQEGGARVREKITKCVNVEELKQCMSR